MNTHILNKKIQAYCGGVFTASTEDAELPPILLDGDTYPNTYILDEMREDIKPDDESDKLTTLLDSSLESLRRLDVVMMNVNYPVSGYVVNSSTLLKADPGLESLVTSNMFSKKRLTASIESNKLDLLAGILSLIVTLFGVKIIKVLTKMRTSHLEKKYNIGTTGFRRIAFAVHSNASIPWDINKRAIESNTPKYYATVKDSKKAITKEYLKAMYDEIVYPNMSNATRAMITRLDDVNKLVQSSMSIAPQIQPFMTDITTMCIEMTSYLTNTQGAGRKFEETLIEKHKPMIDDVITFAKLSEDTLSIKDTAGMTTFETFLPAAEKLFLITDKFEKNRYLALETSSKATAQKLEEVQTKVSRLSKSSRDIKLDEVQGSVQVLRRSIQVLSNLFTVIDNIVVVNTALNRTLYNVNRSLPTTIHN